MKGKHREKHREIKEHIEEGLRKGVTLEEMIAMVYEAAMRVEREEYLRREKDDKGNGYYEREVSLLGKRRKVKVPRSRKGGFRSGRCNVGISVSLDGGASWIDSMVYITDQKVQGNPALSSQGDTLAVFFLEGKVGVDSLSVMYGWRDLGWWRIRRVASAVGYHPDVWPACSGYSGNHYTSRDVRHT